MTNEQALEERPEKPLGERQVSMSNQLARAAQGLNLSEKRLISIGLAATDSVPASHLANAAREGWELTVNAKTYAEQFGIAQQTAYEQLQAASEKLFVRYIRFERPGRRGKPETIKFRWVSKVQYMPGDGYVKLSFTPDVAPHLLGLRKQFTTYKLRHAAALDSVYAWRLFELLRSWLSTGLYAPTIEDFADAMEAPASARKDFKVMRTRIIEPAVSSIQAKAGLLIEWSPVRGGSRRVTSLEFRVRANPQGSLELESADAGPDPEADSGTGA